MLRGFHIREFLALILLVSVFMLLISPLFLEAETVEEQKARLEAELADIEKDIEEKRGLLTTKKAERTSLERDVAILDAQISKAALSIRHRDLTLKNIRDDIFDKEVAIEQLDEKVLRSSASLAQLIRRTREIDDLTLVERALNGSLSDLFADIDRFQVIQRDLDTSFKEIAALRADLFERARVLNEKQAEEEELRGIQEREKQKIVVRGNEKERLLDATRGEEEVYEKIIAAREKSAAEIRSALFSFRDSAAIPFGDAYEFSKAASKGTGVRPALILAILAEESNLGENVGTGNWRDDMHPTRDQPVFEELMAELGFDPDAMPVSKKPWYGWGGAMGPAQFIPSTWILYKDAIADVTGERPPNPWNPRTAIFASATLMADNGADKGGFANERLAALRYFAGWKNATKPAYAFYGDEVMELAEKFQSQIDILEG